MEYAKTILLWIAIILIFCRKYNKTTDTLKNNVVYFHDKNSLITIVIRTFSTSFCNSQNALYVHLTVRTEIIIVVSSGATIQGYSLNVVVFLTVKNTERVLWDTLYV